MAAFNGPAYDFNSYAAGNKVYRGGSTSPHSGGGLDKLGYAERDLKHRAKRNAILRRLKKHQTGNFMSKDWLGGKHA